MPCRSFEDLLLQYSELSSSERGRVDAHVVACAECRDYLAVLGEIDGQLAGEYSGVRAPAGFERRVLMRTTARPTWVPEILDSIGWASVIAAAAAVAWAVVAPRALALISAAWKY
jgi:hypothetical protein